MVPWRVQTTSGAKIRGAGMVAQGSSIMVISWATRCTVRLSGPVRISRRCSTRMSVVVEVTVANQSGPIAKPGPQ